MSAIAGELARLSQQAADLSAGLGRRVDIAAMRICDRTGELPLGPPGDRVSPNGACRLFRAADAWMALNLARDEDRDLIPAWLETDASDDPWVQVAAEGPRHAADALVERAVLLGLPAARVGEVSLAGDDPVRVLRHDAWRPGVAPAAIKVVDLSALWAGPMCGAILAAMGAEVTKIESVRRPDPTRLSTPGLDARLNGAKTRLPLDLAAPDGQAELRDRILAADVLITSARRRGLASLGLAPQALLAARPGLTWVAITGYGWRHDDLPERVAFGDDAAAAGGLVGWTPGGEPRFLGDALSDPLTGLASAVAALTGLLDGGGCLVDAAMARIAAHAAARDR